MDNKMSSVEYSSEIEMEFDQFIMKWGNIFNELKRRTDRKGTK